MSPSAGDANLPSPLTIEWRNAPDHRGAGRACGRMRHHVRVEIHCTPRAQRHESSQGVRACLFGAKCLPKERSKIDLAEAVNLKA